MHNLKTKLMRFNNCKYSLYNGLLGKYQFDHFSLQIDQIQSDPFAPPSKMTLIVPFENTPFNSEWISSSIKMHSFCDAIGRIFAKYVRICTEDNKGSGNGGFCGIRYGNQKVIESNAVMVKNGCIELKILAGLPAFGRVIAAKEAQEFLLKELPEVVKKTFIDFQEDDSYIEEFIQLTERQYWLREECIKKNLVAFVANGSILARASAVDDKPMSHTKVQVFESPKELEVLLTLPDGFCVKGMGIQKGITLIVGGGFHGKSTLLTALAHSIYNHIPGDGREYCVTEESAVFLRAEDGRFIEGTDISAFIHNLPYYKSSTFFQTENASGSSSQAANLVESLEMKAKVILIDEDISATNFLVRDQKMRELVPDYKETITPLIDHMTRLKDQGISFIMVTGALGDFLDIADTVILADEYHYSDQTNKVNTMKQMRGAKKTDKAVFVRPQCHRIVSDKSIDYQGKKGRAVIDGEKGVVKFGRDEIDLRSWYHLHDYSQYGTIAAVLAYAKEKKYYEQSPEKIWEKVAADIEKEGWDILTYVGFDHLSPRQILRKSKQDSEKVEKTKPWRYIVKTRPVEWHAALCRLRSLKCYALEISK